MRQVGEQQHADHGLCQQAFARRGGVELRRRLHPAAARPAHRAATASAGVSGAHRQRPGIDAQRLRLRRAVEAQLDRRHLQHPQLARREKDLVVELEFLRRAGSSDRCTATRCSSRALPRPPARGSESSSSTQPGRHVAARCGESPRRRLCSRTRAARCSFAPTCLASPPGASAPAARSPSANVDGAARHEWKCRVTASASIPTFDEQRLEPPAAEQPRTAPRGAAPARPPSARARRGATTPGAGDRSRGRSPAPGRAARSSRTPAGPTAPPARPRAAERLEHCTVDLERQMEVRDQEHQRALRGSGSAVPRAAPRAIAPLGLQARAACARARRRRRARASAAAADRRAPRCRSRRSRSCRRCARPTRRGCRRSRPARRACAARPLEAHRRRQVGHASRPGSTCAGCRRAHASCRTGRAGSRAGRDAAGRARRAATRGRGTRSRCRRARLR